MTRRAATNIPTIADGSPVVVDGFTYYKRFVDRAQNGMYRIEASTRRRGRARWLLRGKELHYDDDAGVFRFAREEPVVGLAS